MNASRDTLAETIENLIGNGLVARTTTARGSTYRLTDAGEIVAANCIEAVSAITSRDLLQVALKKWPMMVVVAIGRGGRRFNELKEMLPGITPRALTAALRDLQACGLADRLVTESYPPAAVYTLSEEAATLFPMLDSLCEACDAAQASADRVLK